MAGFALAWLLVRAEEVPGASAAVFTVSYAIAVLTAILTGLLATGGLGRLVDVLPIAAAALAVIAVGATVRRPTDRREQGRNDTELKKEVRSCLPSR